ncbi:MAG: SDR family NAD(P)-dependent oxidoreductase [Chitinophagia bacterium]|nr:SDR family NAD(P)-dependent oxidoreductase [Chitinophagia bacterium]NCA29167.1 SDR family NAD(P)-dependent oxidoreductase [Chitinophagia bacterium]
MSKIILITGASAGFGKAIAEKFAAGGWNLILTARRKEKLDAVATAIEQKYKVKILSLIFDVQNKEAVFQQIGGLPTEWQAIDLLVNNAGLALGRDSFENANIEDWETMIDTNVKGLLYTSKATLPYLIKNQGHIINIGSTAGKEVYKDGNVYCASKHAVDAISKAQRIDLLQHKIKVTAIHPGAVETDFSLIRFKGDTAKAAAVYAGYEPLKAEDIADTTWYVANLPKHVCINDLVMTCVSQANSMYLHKDA